MQVCTAVGPLTGVGAGQVVVTQPLPAFGPDGVHDPTGTLAALFVAQVRSTQRLPAAAVCGVQDATGTLVVTSAAGHVVVVQPLLDDSAAGVHEATGTLVVLFELQVVAT